TSRGSVTVGICDAITDHTGNALRGDCPDRDGSDAGATRGAGYASANNLEVASGCAGILRDEKR
ncbi:MAG: hypothetical protein OXH16_12620, partial [Gemmatimonadetes bacterium]|nr:hypothetical protein [Gemmatimonadota bacterium]